MGAEERRAMEMNMDWRHRAACRHVDPELFFPVGNTGPAIAQIEEAKKIWEEMLDFFNGQLPDPVREPIRFEYYVKLFKYYKYRKDA